MHHLPSARHLLLDPANLTEQHISLLLDDLVSYSVDHADLYFQKIHHESWSLENGLIKNGGFSFDQGVGIRAMHGEKTGFAYSEDLNFKTLSQASKMVRNVLQTKDAKQPLVFKKTHLTKQNLYSAQNPLISVNDSDKIQLLQSLDRIARRIDPAVKQVHANLEAQYEVIFIALHNGEFFEDVRPTVRFRVSIIVERNGQREQGFAGMGNRTNYRYFIENNIGTKIVEAAVRQALINLEAKPAPAGSMPVVLGSGSAGVLIHEAVGHGLEGDFNRKGTSAFSGRIGQKVASDVCTIVDDGTVPNACGSLNIDDEGTATQKTVLIEQGILKNYMQDSLNARLMGMKPTGNGRRESYAHLPMPRMTNTYVLPGESSDEEIIGSVQRGLYALDFSGGQVDITSGNFVFSMCEAYMIEDGKVTYPVKGATLIGNGPKVIQKISKVGRHLKLDDGNGFCGKNGQTVPVSVGQPMMKIDQLTVGGTT